MVEENQSDMTDRTEERINAVLARAPEAQASAAEDREDTNDTKDTRDREDRADREEDQAVTETPSEILNPSPELHAAAHPAAHPADEPAPLPETDPTPLESPSAHAPSAPAEAFATDNGIDPMDVGIASGVQYRQDTRYEVEGDAEVFVKTGSMGTTLLRGHILDLSSTGCFIQTMARVMIKPGTVVQLIFSVYGSTFRIDATSRFARMRVGVGFRFLEMDEPTHKRLHAVLTDIRSRLIHENQPVIDRAIAE